jgi:DNA mismatch repair protein MutS2
MEQSLNSAGGRLSWERLEWPIVCEILAGYGQGPVARDMCANLVPDLPAEEIAQRWSTVDALKDLIIEGYRAPVGEVQPMEKLLRAAEMGHIFEPDELRTILGLLYSTRTAYAFSSDFANRCFPLQKFKAQLFPLAKLTTAIDQAIGPDGKIKDTASSELNSIRQAKVALRRRIEDKLKHYLQDRDVSAYVQEEFFTVRADRYVVPISLDGRGRVKGAIFDTSASGQTLFLEPVEIAPMNHQLQELELNEKLEIIRILRVLSASVAGEVDHLRINYELLVELDFLSSQAAFAADIGACAVRIAEHPSVDLRRVRHPILARDRGNTVVANDIELKANQSALIVSGPNAGGKTVVLKTLGLIQLMAKAGLLIPADPESQIYLFEQVHVELGDAQSLRANLSTFSGHLLGLKPVLQSATSRDLVLMDELAVGTEPQTGAAIAQAVLESLADRGAKTVVTTHFDGLKLIATNDARFRNASMEFSGASLRPTYRLILDVPGQSFGLELAAQIGIDDKIISRARQLRGTQAEHLDQAIRELQNYKSQLMARQQELDQGLIDLENERENLETAKLEIDQIRKRAAGRMESMYEQELSTIREQFEKNQTAMRALMKRVEAELPSSRQIREEWQNLKSDTDNLIRGLHGQAGELSAKSENVVVPGAAIELAGIREGDRVFVTALMKEAIVSKINHGADDSLEVTAGSLKFRTSIENVRLLPRDESRRSSKPGTRSHGPKPRVVSATPEFVMQTPTNSVNLRGMDQDQAIQSMWKFVDQAILRGEGAVIIIHGHGTDRLKSGVRAALASNSGYQLNHRPGNPEEGGDGVTVVFF